MDLIEKRLTFEHILTSRLDGKLSVNARQEVLEAFKNCADSMILLVSLKVGGTVLNLTSASAVFLMDPWWNPAIAQQALERVWRIGQKKQVQAFHIIVNKTIEQKIVSIYADKQKAANLALGKNDTSFIGDAGAISVQEMIRIFKERS